MSRPETSLNLNQPETQPEPQNGGQEETKKGWLKKAWEKTKGLTSGIDKNDTYITTLDIQGHNRAFLDKADRLANFWDHAKAWASSQVESNKIEDQTKGIISLNLKEASGQLVAEAQNNSAETARQAEAITEQRVELAQIATAEARKEPKTNAEEVAKMIERFGPNVKGGYADLVAALQKNEEITDPALKEKAVETLTKLKEGAKWGAEQKKTIDEILNPLIQERDEIKANWKKFAALAKPLAELIEQHNPLKFGNKDLANKLNSGENLEQAALDLVLQAINSLKNISGKWPQDTKNIFAEMEALLPVLKPEAGANKPAQEAKTEKIPSAPVTIEIPKSEAKVKAKTETEAKPKMTKEQMTEEIDKLVTLAGDNKTSSKILENALRRFNNLGTQFSLSKEVSAYGVTLLHEAPAKTQKLILEGLRGLSLNKADAQITPKRKTKIRRPKTMAA